MSGNHGGWGGVRERVERLRALPQERTRGYFGATHGHAFTLDEPLTAAELAHLEGWLGVELPTDYRRFLSEVGAGGAGPAYGVFPVRRTEAGGWEWAGDGGDLTDAARMAAPFPEPVDPEALAALQADRPEEEDFADTDAFDPVYEAWEQRLVELLWTAERTSGAICLCHYGCARRAWLVVSGPQRGLMWADDRCDEEDLEPMRTADGEPMTFADWYLQWLAEAETRLCAVETPAVETPAVETPASGTSVSPAAPATPSAR